MIDDIKNKIPDINPYQYEMDIEDNDDDNYTHINIGPSHPATHGTIHLKTIMDGEKIIDIEPVIGYLHSGFEKIAEHHTYNQWITTSDRMNYLSPLCNNIGYAIAVEDLLGIEVPKRAQYIRIILCELSRIYDHFLCQGFLGLDLGAFTVLLWAYVEREKLNDLFEYITGTRLTASFSRIGGLAMDFPKGIEKDILDFCKEAENGVREIEKLFNKNKIFLDRVIDVGRISAEDALDWSLSGPILRASGVKHDLRKAKPYSSYDEIEFDIQTDNNCDVYARYLVRNKEIRESVKIIRQAIKKLPKGPVNLFTQKIKLPKKQDTYTDMESLIYHFKLMMKGDTHGIKMPKGEIYSSTEAANGELGFHIVSDGGSSAYRLSVRSPSLIHLQAYPFVTKNHKLADFPAIMGSFNIIAGELDR